MWFVHSIFVIIAMVILFVGIIKPLDWDDSITLFVSVVWKGIILISGSLLMWYSLYMLGWRVIRVVAA